MMVSLIVAMARNRIIGNRGAMPWHLPDDLQWFKRQTMGHSLLMGRRTYEAIGRALPGRRIMVLSRNPDYVVVGGVRVSTIQQALDLTASESQLFVCGGGEIYRQTLPLAQRIYLTELDIEVDGDTSFPEFDVDAFDLIYEENRNAEFTYRFLVWEKKDVPVPAKRIFYDEI